MEKSCKIIWDDEIYVDGGCNSLTGKDAWGSVVDCFGKDLISKNTDLLNDMKLKNVQINSCDRSIIVCNFNDVSSQQNNGAELLSLIAGLRIAIKCDNIKRINSDSELIIKYWSVGHVNKKTKERMDPNKLKYINECAILRKTFETNGGQIIKISGKNNLADLGKHK